MKKKLTAAAALLGAAMLFSACSSGSATSFTANWYSNTASNAALPGTSETLVYKVTQNTENSTNGDFTVLYSNGTYTTTLSVEQKNNDNLYCYRTELNITVQYLVNGETTQPKEDKVSSEVYFRSTQSGLLPVSSFKEVVSRSPAGMNPSSAETAYRDYHFSISATYDEDCSSGIAVYTDLTSEETKADAETTKFSIEDGDSYLDNEELLFALRGISYSSAKQFQVYNASVRRVQTVRATPSEEKSDEFRFTMNGEERNAPISYYPVSIAISENQGGGTQTAWYAKTTDLSRNVYRNVMLRLETPLSYNLGSLVYELQSADFTNAG